MIGQKMIYTMTKDSNGALWVKPDEILEKAKIYKSQLSELHERYGHISFETLKTLPECPSFNIIPRCEACEQGKATKPPARNQEKACKIRTSKILERLHADLVSPIEPITPIYQYTYVLVVTDDFSRYMVTKPLQKKSDTAKVLIEIINRLEALCQPSRVVYIQADWGGEFRNRVLEKGLQERGINLKETVPGHSEQIVLS